MGSTINTQKSFFHVHITTSLIHFFRLINQTSLSRHIKHTFNFCEGVLIIKKIVPRYENNTRVIFTISVMSIFFMITEKSKINSRVCRFEFALDRLEPKSKRVFLFLFFLFRFRAFNITFPDIIEHHKPNKDSSDRFFVKERRKKYE